MDLLFEMTVKGTDHQEAGKLDRILADPATREVTHVVVRTPLASEEVIVPLSLVQGTHRGELLLHCLTGELQRMPRYYEGRRSVPPAGRIDTAPSEALWPPRSSERKPRLTPRVALGVPDGACELGPETEVSLLGGSRGKLTGVGTEADFHAISQLHISIPGFGRFLVSHRQVLDAYSDPIRVDTTVEELGRRQHRTAGKSSSTTRSAGSITPVRGKLRVGQE